MLYLNEFHRFYCILLCSLLGRPALTVAKGIFISISTPFLCAINVLNITQNVLQNLYNPQKLMIPE